MSEIIRTVSYEVKIGGTVLTAAVVGEYVSLTLADADSSITAWLEPEEIGTVIEAITSAASHLPPKAAP